MPSHGLPLCTSVSQPPLIRGQSTLPASSLRNQLIKGLIIQCSHLPRVWGLGLQHTNFGGGGGVHKPTHDIVLSATWVILHSGRAGDGAVKCGREMKAGACLQREACRLVLVTLWLAGQELWHIPQWAQHPPAAPALLVVAMGGRVDVFRFRRPLTGAGLRTQTCSLVSRSVLGLLSRLFCFVRLFTHFFLFYSKSFS